MKLKNDYRRLIIFESSGKYLSMEAKFVEYYNNKKLYQGIQNQVPNTIYTLQNQIKNNCKIPKEKESTSVVASTYIIYAARITI